MILSNKQTSAPDRGVNITGLYLSNATWDFSHNMLKDCKTHEQYFHVQCVSNNSIRESLAIHYHLTPLFLKKNSYGFSQLFDLMPKRLPVLLVVHRFPQPNNRPHRVSSVTGKNTDVLYIDIDQLLALRIKSRWNCLLWRWRASEKPLGTRIQRIRCRI